MSYRTGFSALTPEEQLLVALIGSQDEAEIGPYRGRVLPLLSRLDPVEADVLHRHFGLAGRTRQSFASIARDAGHGNTGTIRQMQNRALVRLRHWVGRMRYHDIIRAAEREACAALAEDMGAPEIARAIRARQWEN
jgi:hypothetical protein